MRSRTRRPCQRWILVGATLATALALSVVVWAAGKGKPAAGTQNSDGTAKGDTVHVYLQTVPARKAQVKWGGRLLGMIPAPKPLIIERQRDSGPLDVVIRAAGFLPVHTRLYTFTDSRVSVKLTPPSGKSRLFGYKQEPAPNPDGGVPAEPATQGPGPPAETPASPGPAHAP